ncbi:hypothetical protein [Autumnicola musiva]|uniref:Uncharacterized protein n=1 Tax=Autumnicola musiva TaxID=3075589 RepID=A0ABU3D137_9FLAO|nr:hypothetical protein [Zunongwangia sp. F117]MDT0675126.1 hypothetical protein [Zunongwangia sp. F117]
MNENKILFQGQYINGKALAELYDFSKNKYITKTAPGVGVTTALMNYQAGNLIIISPLTPMIKKKSYAASSYKSDKQFFKCTGLNGKWKTVSDYFISVPKNKQNLIINCTPDSICSIRDKNPNLFDRLLTIPVVVDEYDNVVFQSSLRANCGRFLELLFNKWKANFTLTTATPNYRNIDVPSNIEINYIQIGPSKKETKNLLYTTKYKDAFIFMHRELEEGRKVACFSNNSKVHRKKISELQKSLVGHNLELKLEAYDVKTDVLTDEDLFDVNNLIIYSGKYFIGFDIEQDISIVVISEAGHPATTTPLSQVIQALYRCRGTLHNALFVNSRLGKLDGDVDSAVNLELDNFKEEIEFTTQKASKYWDSFQIKKSDKITKELFCDRAAIATNTLTQIYRYQLMNKDFIKSYFQSYGYSMIPYQAPNLEELNSKSIRFNERLTNLMRGDLINMQLRYDEVVSKVNFAQQGSHNHNQVMERLTSIILKIINDTEILKKLNNEKLKQRDLYAYLDKLFQRNFTDKNFTDFKKRTDQSLRQIKDLVKPEIKEKLDDYLYHWHLFYAVYRMEKLDLPIDIKRYFIIRASAADLKILEMENKSVSSALDVVKSKVELELGSALTDSEISDIKRIVETGLDNPKSLAFCRYSEKSIKNSFKDFILYLINPEADFEEKNSRVFNPATRLPKLFRPLIPFKLVLVDLVSANAQFVDKLIGTKMYKDVYGNIISNQDISRNKAKQLYSHILNSYHLKRNEAERFYHEICGYEKSSAANLASLTAQVEKGSFYKQMTRFEKDIIITYNDHLDNEGIRLHDGLLFLPWKLNSALPRFVNNYEFEVSYFNSNESYIGDILHENITIGNLPF